MWLTELRWTRYRIPYKRPLVTAHGVFPFREGAIVEAVTQEGVVGVGEIAPPPGFGHMLDEALAALNNMSHVIVGHTAEGALASLAQTSADMYGWNDTPSVWCGVETALWDVHGKVQGRSVSQSFDLPHNDAKSSVPVNALISASSTDVAAEAARTALANGFRCVKLKVGMSPSVDDEIARIAAVRDAIGPDAHLRIDANEVWDFDQALATLSRAADYGIQYCEQPLRRNDIDGLRALRLASPVRIAADESADTADTRIRILQSEAVDILVIKLQSQGGVWEARLNMRYWMSRHEVECVVTSSLESGIGVTAALHVAAATPEMTLECGLATLDLLEDDLIVEPPHIEGGAMFVPEGPGLGVELDREALARYAI